MFWAGAWVEMVELIGEFSDCRAQSTVLGNSLAGVPSVECDEVSLEHLQQLGGQRVTKADMHDGQHRKQEIWGHKDFGHISHQYAVKSLRDNEASVKVTGFEEAIETSFVSCLGTGDLALCLASYEPGAELTL